MENERAREFVRTHHRAVLATRRRDGSVQLSPVVCTIDDEGDAVISSRETAIKVKNLRREPHASLCVFEDSFFGSWVQIDGVAEIVSLPDAMDGLVRYYRDVAGEHPDWDEYRAAMEQEQRVLVKVRIERSGPDVHG